MKKYFLLFLSISSFLSAQEITDKKEFRKCRKVFSKKICLSDEDKDALVYYLDKCPKEIGPAENRLDKKNRPYLKRSKFITKNKNCSCEEGYITKTEIWAGNKCMPPVILD